MTVTHRLPPSSSSNFTLKPVASEMRQSMAVVVPVFNEQACLQEFHRRVCAVLQTITSDWQLIYIDDGSRDASFEICQQFAIQDQRVQVIKFARNFGKEAAMGAGLDHAHADVVVMIDADLQDPPELIPAMLQEIRAGNDVVYGVRSKRDGETWLKKLTAAGFYRVMSYLSETPIPRDTGDFRLMTQRAVVALRALRERQRFMKGLFGWIGFNQKAFPYARDARHAGVSKFNFWRLWNFALEGITSFSTVPLRLATYLGAFSAFFAFCMGVWIIGKTILFGEPVRGYPSLMSVVLFFGGTQLMALGLIGEYLGRLYMESKQRPLYLIDQFLNQTLSKQSDT